MDCREARWLLDHGTAPGARSSEQTALGFHLASCAECRAYRAVLQAQLLSKLLDVAPPDVAPLPRPAPAGPGRTRRPLVLLLGSLLIVGLVVAAPLLRSLLRIQQNMQAMYAPLPTATAVPSRVPASPTAPPTSTPMHQPTASAPTAAPSAAPASPTPSATPQPTRPPQPTQRPAPPSGGPLTVLLLGSDQRPDETAPARTDAIIIARIDPQAGRIALLSLPRDLWIDIPGYGQSRINAVYGLGEASGVHGSGIALTRATLGTLLGIPIDHYVYINFSGFTNAIDAVGGVTIDVPKELYDSQYPAMDYSYMTVHFLPGVQHMDGATALIYSRIRHPDSDFQRMQRQQQVVAAVLDQVRGRNIFEGVERVEALTTILSDYVKTDLTQSQLLGLAWSLRAVQPADVERYVLEETMVTFGVGDDQWAETALPGSIESLVEKLLGTPLAHN